ncbi:hypothetical protein [Adlercreutzia agrestimuris]|uniref:VG15 protein n=1 Tax=Adlercreutzia agrestimuris TaxID=2941324 RepID=UPI00203C5DCB|nr:hypothetical protein [Adlercreutzia agrestimuris]
MTTSQIATAPKPRVPTGNDTCEFCIMLASRGFAFLSKQSAGSTNHYHPNCDCRIVPGFEGETQVEGYDPDALYQKYLENKERKTKKLITKEIGAKPLEKEREVAEILAIHRGWKIKFLKEINESHIKTPDVLIDGETWEIKVPEKWNGKTIKNQFKRAIGKGTPNLVISGTKKQCISYRHGVLR